MPKVVPEYKQEARKRIIEGATKTFSQKGYQKTKMTDIGESLGVSKGAIYQYFNSKEELFFEVIDNLMNQINYRLTEFLQKEGLDCLKSEQYFYLYLPSPKASTKFKIDIIHESLYNEKLNKKISNEYNEAINNAVLFFEAYKEKNIIKKSIDSRKKAMELFGMLEGLKILLFYGASLEEMKETWVSFANTFLDEIREI